MTLETFKGPLFIIGISRSGTKLLRDLLNNHSRVGVADIESKFIPLFYRLFGEWDENRLKNDFDMIFRQFEKTPFYEEMSLRNRPVAKKECFDSIEEWTLAGVIEALFRTSAQEHLKGKMIWGDKTPNYLLFVPLLKQLFPRARFIHIIRDVRDISLSARKAWGRNIYITAQRWIDYISKCRKDAAKFSPSDYIEVTYEQLINDPAPQLAGLCAFLGIKFEDHMTVLTRSPEDIGDTKGETDIIRANREKWKSQLDARQIEKIEAICFPLLADLGYTMTSPVRLKKPQRLNQFTKRIYSFHEGIYLLRGGSGEETMKRRFKKLIRKIKFRLNP